MLFKTLIFLLFMLTPQQRLADRIVAIVNDEPILLSELRQTIPSVVTDTGQFAQLMQTNLEALINQTLILQEIKRLNVLSLERGEVDAGIRIIVESYGSEQELRRELREIGLTMEELRNNVQRKLLIMKFIDYRFRQFAGVDEHELINYYETEFSERYSKENPGITLPGFDSQRTEIERILKERAINRALDTWLTQAREKAKIVNRMESYQP